MADEDVQQHDPDPETVPAEAPGIQEPAPEPAETEAAGSDEVPGDEGIEEPSPLEPGGKRFKQVYARAKDAETKLQQLREEKARLEGELAATQKVHVKDEPKPEPRHTWAQLEAGIEEGKITRAWAMDYDRQTLKQELAAEFEHKLREERQSGERSKTVSGELAQYKQALPAILDRSTPERQKVEREFSYLVNLGHDAKDLRTELLAVRMAMGDITQVKEKQLAQTIPNGRSTMQDITAGGKPKADAKDPLKTISVEQRKYYQRMIDKGQYKGWADVREELTFTPKR